MVESSNVKLQFRPVMILAVQAKKDLAYKVEAFFIQLATKKV